MSIGFFSEDSSLPSIFADKAENDDPWCLDLSQLAGETSEDLDGEVDPWELPESSIENQAQFATLDAIVSSSFAQTTPPSEQVPEPQAAEVFAKKVVVENSSKCSSIREVCVEPENLNSLRDDSTDSTNSDTPCIIQICYVEGNKQDSDLPPLSPFASRSSLLPHLNTPLSPTSPASDHILITDSPSKAEKSFHRNFSTFPHFAPTVPDRDSYNECMQPPPLEPVHEIHHAVFSEPTLVLQSADLAFSGRQSRAQVVDSDTSLADATRPEYLIGQSEKSAQLLPRLGELQVLACLDLQGSATTPFEEDAELNQSFCSVRSLKRRGDGEERDAVTMADIYANATIVRKRVRKPGILLTSRNFRPTMKNVAQQSSLPMNINHHSASPEKQLDISNLSAPTSLIPNPSVLSKHNSATFTSPVSSSNYNRNLHSRTLLTPTLQPSHRPSTPSQFSPSFLRGQSEATSSTLPCPSFSSSLASLSFSSSSGSASLSSSPSLVSTLALPSFNLNSSSRSFSSSLPNSTSARSSYSQALEGSQYTPPSCRSNNTFTNSSLRSPLMPLTVSSRSPQVQFNTHNTQLSSSSGSFPSSNNNMLSNNSAKLRPNLSLQKPVISQASLLKPASFQQHSRSPMQFRPPVSGALSKSTSLSTSVFASDSDKPDNNSPPPAFEGFRSGQGKLLSVSKSNMQRAMRLMADIDGAPL